ncbi:unnamed protein product [Soboliphyme baturini]|uniref:DH domain-containing protein n=1 Tax=Soboliphyme baturini TaxID=241478 RepID=A0A183IT67_9BILA|nr:unnamed protein product [Soboliphyme baturini]
MWYPWTCVWEAGAEEAPNDHEQQSLPTLSPPLLSRVPVVVSSDANSVTNFSAAIGDEDLSLPQDIEIPPPMETLASEKLIAAAAGQENAAAAAAASAAGSTNSPEVVRRMQKQEDEEEEEEEATRRDATPCQTRRDDDPNETTDPSSIYSATTAAATATTTVGSGGTDALKQQPPATVTTTATAISTPTLADVSCPSTTGTGGGDMSQKLSSDQAQQKQPEPEPEPDVAQQQRLAREKRRLRHGVDFPLTAFGSLSFASTAISSVQLIPDIQSTPCVLRYVLEELVTSEKDYVKDLGSIVEACVWLCCIMRLIMIRVICRFVSSQEVLYDHRLPNGESHCRWHRFVAWSNFVARRRRDGVLNL